MHAHQRRGFQFVGLLAVAALLVVASRHERSVAHGAGSLGGQATGETGIIVAGAPGSLQSLHAAIDSEADGWTLYVPPGVHTLDRPIMSAADYVRIEGPGTLRFRPAGRDWSDLRQAAIDLSGRSVRVNCGIDAGGAYYAAVRLRREGHVGGQYTRIHGYREKGVTVNHAGRQIGWIIVGPAEFWSDVDDVESQVAVQIDPRSKQVWQARIENIIVRRQAGGGPKGAVAVKLATCETAIVDQVWDFTDDHRGDIRNRPSLVLAEGLGTVEVLRSRLSNIAHFPDVTNPVRQRLETLRIRDTTFTEPERWPFKKMAHEVDHKLFGPPPDVPADDGP